MRTAQRRVERRSTALGIRRVQTKTPRDRRTARRARGWNERQTNPSVGKGGGQLRLRPRRRLPASGLAAGAQSRAAALGNVPAISHQAKQPLRRSVT